MNQHFTIPGQLPGYNQLNGGRHWAIRRDIKQRAMGTVSLYARRAHLKKITSPVMISMTCYEPNRRRDEDNVIAGAYKVILDALQQEHLLPNDSRWWVKMGTVRVETDKDCPRIEVEIREREDQA